MASLIFLGNLFGKQKPMNEFRFGLVNPTMFNNGYEVAIAKGNIIEGIEAKE